MPAYSPVNAYLGLLPGNAHDSETAAARYSFYREDFLPAFGTGGSPPTYYQQEIAALFRRGALHVHCFLYYHEHGRGPSFEADEIQACLDMKGYPCTLC